MGVGCECRSGHALAGYLQHSVCFGRRKSPHTLESKGKSGFRAQSQPWRFKLNRSPSPFMEKNARTLEIHH